MDSPIAEADSTGRPVVLVADDDPDIADVVRATLEDEGLTVEVVADLAPAPLHAAIERIEPACLLLDGETALGYGRSWDEAARIARRARPFPVVMFSASRADADEARAGTSARSQAARLFAVIEKPFDLDELVATVHRALAAAQPGEAIGDRRELLFSTLERLLAIAASSLPEALRAATSLIADVFAVEKVDAWLPDYPRNELVVVGVSPTELGRRQVALGLDRFPLDGGCRVVEAFRTGQPFRTGRADLDERVHPGVRGALGVRSLLAVPLRIAGHQRGVLLLASTQPERFDGDDERFLESVARWVAIVAHRAELLEQAAQRDHEQRLHAEARQERERLNQLFQQAPTLMAMLEGPEHVYTLANPRYLQVVDRASVVGQRVRDVLPELVEQGITALLDEVYASGTPAILREQLIHITRGGASVSVWFDLVFQPVVDAGGAVSGIFVQGVDVSEQVAARQRAERLAGELRAERDRLTLAQQASAIGTYEWDFASDVVSWRPELEALYGLPAGGFDGRLASWIERLHPEDREQALAAALAAREQATDLDTRFRIVRPDGSVRHLQARGRVLHDDAGQPCGLIGVNVDVTEREQALASAEDALRARDEFLSIASHELRTPLAGLNGLIQLLQRQLARDEPDLQRVRRHLRGVAQSAARLGRLVEDLLDVSRLRTGQLLARPERHDLAPLVREAVERVRLLHPDREVALDASCESTACEVRADQDRLSQVIANLLENAIKYSPPHARVDVRMREVGGGVEVQVADAGIGLPPGSEERIFEPFGRATNATEQNIPGMGLGLYVSRQIVEAHGGRLWAESPGEGHGAVFSLWLPAASAPRAES